MSELVKMEINEKYCRIYPYIYKILSSEKHKRTVIITATSEESLYICYVMKNYYDIIVDKTGFFIFEDKQYNIITVKDEKDLHEKVFGLEVNFFLSSKLRYKLIEKCNDYFRK